MTTTRRTMGWIMLMLALGGCSSYRAASLPGSEQLEGPPISDRPLEDIDVGDSVRIVVADGTKVRGKVAACSNRLLTLKTRQQLIGSPGATKRVDEVAMRSPYLDLAEFADRNLVTVQTAHIVSVEKSVSAGGKTAWAAAGAVALIGVVAVGISLASMDIGN